jgi:hypothetical protein
LPPPLVCHRHAECSALAVENIIFSQMYLQINTLSQVSHYEFCPRLMPHATGSAAWMMATMTMPCNWTRHPRSGIKRRVLCLHAHSLTAGTR